LLSTPRPPTFFRPRKTDKQKVCIKQAKNSYPKRKKLISNKQRSVKKKKSRRADKSAAIEAKCAKGKGIVRATVTGLAGAQASGIDS